MEGRPKGPREVGASGGCCACKRPLGGARPCICGTCLALPDEGLGGLRAKVQELKAKSAELQASLRALVDSKTAEERRQLKLATLRATAAQCRVATQRTTGRLDLLNTRYQHAELDARLGQARRAISSALDELTAQFEDGTRHTGKDNTMKLLRKYGGERRAQQRRALEDMTRILAIAVSSPPAEIGAAVTGAELVDACAANAELGQYYGDAFGQAVLLFGIIAPRLQLPVGHRWAFGSTKTRVWQPENFWDVGLVVPEGAPALCFPASGAPAQRQETLAALADFERAVAVALSARPGLRPACSLFASPLEWLAEFCAAAVQEQSPGGGAGVGLLPAGAAVVEGDDLASPTDLDGPGDDEEEEDWELMAADVAGGLQDNGGGGAMPSLFSMVDRVRSIANGYMGR